MKTRQAIKLFVNVGRKTSVLDALYVTKLFVQWYFSSINQINCVLSILELVCFLSFFSDRIKN